MRITADTHVHSEYSFDGHDALDAIVEKAIRHGLDYIAFTEHYDVTTSQVDTFDFVAFCDEIDKLNSRYPNITILKGIEVSEPHNCPSAFAKIRESGFDFTLGSVHFVGGNNVCHKQTADLEAINDDYYAEVLRLSEFKGIDAIAHIDHIRRGVGFDKYDEKMLSMIFHNMVKNDIALEINTSGLRRFYGSPFPSYDKIELYISCGGSKVVIGSDSHSLDDLMDRYNEVLARLVAFPLQFGVFAEHKFTPIKIYK